MKIDFDGLEWGLDAFVDAYGLTKTSDNSLLEEVTILHLPSPMKLLFDDGRYLEAAHIIGIDLSRVVAYGVTDFYGKVATCLSCGCLDEIAEFVDHHNGVYFCVDCCGEPSL